MSVPARPPEGHAAPTAGVSGEFAAYGAAPAPAERAGCAPPAPREHAEREGHLDAADSATEGRAPVERRVVRVHGIVQGVGFRPFVHRLAQAAGLSGLVRNDAAGVCIEVEGRPNQLDAFERALAREAPPRARVDDVRSQRVPACHDAGFVIVESTGGRVSTAIGPDSAVCDACLAELFDPVDRRWRYAFINCTHCGPRYTLTRALPYDRRRTSMARFDLCGECGREYRDPADRRFHAEPNACPVCGPRLSLVDASGASIDGDPLADALRRLAHGEILAVKGLGGFHLACDARNAAAVERLRTRKQREEKPLAVMAANAASLDGVADMDSALRRWLESAERPIVLLKKAAHCDEQLLFVAPGVGWIGAMLPYTPLQYLLFHESAGRPAGTAWLRQPQPLLLVMTSANPHGEPLVRDNAEALSELSGIADAVLMHDRDIVVRCDDSVVRAGSDGAMQFLRRARGYTPLAIPLSRDTPPVLALGGWFKNTVCLTRGGEAFVSQHIGDLDNALSCNFLDETVAHLRRVLDVVPAAVAHDLHPDFHSSRIAAELAAALGVPALGVQHHHAHIAAVLAEHRIDEPVLGLALDGVGLGSDGAAWGGELLRVDGATCVRLGHLRTLPLPGGDRAAREPWRMAAAALHLLRRRDDITRHFAHRPGAATISDMLAKNLNTPQTSSMGRWFDAAAGLLGVRDVMTFEGQAAMELEGLAERVPLPDAPPQLWTLGADHVLDLLPLLARLADESRKANGAVLGAALFHAVTADALAAWVIQAARATGLARVAGGGGCFLNAILVRRLRTRLADAGIELIEARALPPNDGGLSLGQAWVAQRALFATNNETPAAMIGNNAVGDSGGGARCV